VRTRTPYQTVDKPFAFPDHPEWGVTYWDWTVVPVVDASGSVEMLVFSLKDVTPRKRAEMAVVAERKRFEDVLEMMPAYAILLTPDHRVAYANHTFREWFGDGGEKKCFEFLFNRAEPCESCETFTAFKTGKPHFWEWIGPNGHYYDIYDYPFTDTDGSPLIMEIGVDVSAHKKTQEALRKSEERYRSLTVATSQVTWTTDAQGQVIDDLPLWRSFTGQKTDELMGGGWIEAIHPDDRTATKNIWNHAVRSKTIYQTEFRVRRHDGVYRYMSACGVPVQEPDGSIREWVGTCTDITERRQTQDRIRFTNVLLELFTRKTSRKEYLDQVVRYLQVWSGCQCLGIRLTDADGWIPYVSWVGFTEGFLETENRLSLRQDNCLCIRAITQSLQSQDGSLITAQGSFQCGNTRCFMETLTADEKSRYRETCMQHGFASLAVIPIRYRETILGAIHLADTREGRISPEKMEFVENIALLVGEAVHRFDIEEELRFSEERYRSLVELSPDGIAAEQNGVLVFLNSAGAKILNCRQPDEWIGRPITDIVHPDSRDRVQRRLQASPEQLKSTVTQEEKFIRGDGSEIDVEIAVAALAYQNKPTRQIVFHDITERKIQQMALQLSESRLREAQKVAHMGNWEWDIINNTLWWSDEVYHIFGLNPEDMEVAYETFLQHVHPEDQALVRRSVEEAIQEKKQYSLDHRIIRTNGIECVVHEQAEIICDAQHNPVRMIGTVQDITERIRAQEAVRQSEERFRLMAQATDDVFWMSTPGIGQMLYISPAYEKLWGKSCTSLYRDPKSFLDAVHPEDRNMLIEGLKGHAKGKWNFEYRVLWPDGSVHWVHDVGYPVFNEKGVLAVMTGMIRDITMHKNSESEILAKQKELQSLTIQLQLAEEAERRRLAQDLHDSIGQILAFSGRELKSLRKMAPEALAEPLRKVAEQLDLAVEQSRTLSFDLSPGLLYDLGLEVALEDLADRMAKERKIKCTFETCRLPKPLTDDIKVLLYRSVRELLINAVKHAEADKIKISCLRSSCEIYIKVEDNGRGFDTAMLEKKAGHPNGFGLLNLRERLNHIGGCLKLDSKKGKGTKALLIAPLDIDRDTKGDAV
jgi:PAS domain S-box-containing protein